MDKHTPALIAFATSHPSCSTSDIAQHLGIAADAAYRLCKKHLVGNKGPKGMKWIVVDAPAPKAASAKRPSRKDKPNHPVHQCDSAKKATNIVKMLAAAWNIPASSTDEHVVLVPMRQKRQARALIQAFLIGAGEPANGNASAKTG